MTNNVPVIHPVCSSLGDGHVRRVVNVVGNAAGFVLSGVATRNSSCRSILGRTRRGNCTRTSPAGSIDNCSTTHGVTVLTALNFRSTIAFGSIRMRNVRGVTGRSVRRTARVNCIVGLLTVTHRSRSNVSLGIRPSFVHGNRPLTGISNTCGTIYIHNGYINSIVFCNRKTNSLPATDTIIDSIVGIVLRHGLRVANGQNCI